ncbi:RNA polymerase sigma factor [Paenibacillus sp. FSL L8-0436]|uniref:RNA polymerase sigma factor n=1 Tax=Paenibacillus sp. FSL L8-0436 TaxID=2954686 RepID=UPI003158CB51
MITDKQLIEGCRSGRREMLGLLVDRYKDDLYRFCRHLTLNAQDAEDLFQEVWVRVIRKLEKYDCERSFKAWLFQVTVNLHRDRYRRWKKLQHRFLGVASFQADFLNIRDSSPLTEEALLRNERNAELEQGLRALSKRYLAPLVLYYYNEFSYEEIAEMLGIPVGTVKSRLNQGKKLLQTSMQHVKEET